MRISGKVTDKMGNPLAGASIYLVSDNSVGQNTDKNGNFNFESPKIIPTSVIIADYLGYVKRPIIASSLVNGIILMEPSQQQLDEVEIVFEKPAELSSFSKNKKKYAIIGTIAILGISAFIIYKTA